MEAGRAAPCQFQLMRFRLRAGHRPTTLAPDLYETEVNSRSRQKFSADKGSSRKPAPTRRQRAIVRVRLLDLSLLLADSVAALRWESKQRLSPRRSQAHA